MKKVALVLVVATVVTVVLAGDDQNPASKVVTAIMDDFTKAKTDADEKYQKAPALVRLQETRVAAIQKAGKAATARLEKLIADAKKSGSELAVAEAQESLDNVKASMRESKLVAVGLDKLAVKFRGHYYMLILRPIGWKDAKKYCESLGGHLAYIETKDEREFLEKQMGNCCVWVGCTDEPKKGDWRWLSSKPVDKSLWKAPAPRANDPNRHYGVLEPGGMEDLAEDPVHPWQSGFICEWE